MGRGFAFLLFLVCGCAGTWHAPLEFSYVPVTAGEFEIASYQKVTDSASPVHIYIEGDGHAFDNRGRPTHDPTPRSSLVRSMASDDDAPNVVYLGRPCQYIMSDACTVADWTTGRFSQDIVDSMAVALHSVAHGRPIVLIGYSGGALISGLLIKQNPDLNIQKWITVAGVLNHQEWTEYFNDSPLSASMSLGELPRVSQLHYVAENDKIVPYHLSKKWTGGKNLITVPSSTHTDFPNLELNFD